MARRLLTACALVSVAACGGDGSSPGDDGGGGAPDAAPPVTPRIAPAPDLLPAADPKLAEFAGWPLRFAVETAGAQGASCVITLDRQGTPVATLEASPSGGVCEVVWNGRDAAGAALAPGAVAVTASLQAAPETGNGELAAAAAVIEVVRLGIADIALAGADPGTRAPLMYSETDGQAGGFWEVPTGGPSWRIGPEDGEPAAASRVELGDGSARPAPAIWGDLLTPPLDAAAPDGVEDDSFNLPSAWVAGALIDFHVGLDSTVAGGASGAPAQAEVRLVPPADMVAEGDLAFVAGGEVVVRTASSWVPAVGRFDRTVRWTFEARVPGGAWVPVPGAFTTQHRLYGMVAQPIFDYPDVPHRPWVDIVDTVALWVDGAAASEPEVAAKITEGVYWYLGLVYDTQNGASAYTGYPNWDWTDATFDVVEFQRRAWGNVINCSDAASILSTYGNMVGADIRYHILERPDGNGFDLNYIRAIGMADFDETPFIGDRGAFRYHAVTGPPDGSFYDATLALDGDGDPMTPPHTLLLSQGMVPVDYLTALSSQWDLIGVYMDEKVRLQ